ncbi:MAG: RtcB family protein [Chloroflexota bacterium]|nr:RtcB family protein [Chloroflexota bacterium]
MRVPGRIYGDQEVIDHLVEDVRAGKEWNALHQIINVATLPGIVEASMAMADVHPGYGFPIGGVAAFDVEGGVISMAGVGYDINCGVRTLRTLLTREEIADRQEELADALYRIIPAGLGSTGDIHLSKREIDQVLRKGARFSLERGYGIESDLDFIEERGCIDGADPDAVSDKAKRRQLKEVGTLGSGNHYLEVQVVEEIYAPDVADVYGLFPNQILISIHCGSRALGHQVGTDYTRILTPAAEKYGIELPDRDLASVPFHSPEGQRYYGAMNAGINCAFANRQALAHLARVAFQKVLGTRPQDIPTLYEVAHNTAKVEHHEVDGEKRPLIVHRKGATRAFGPGQEELPEAYRPVGQPVLVGGTMGTSSFILHGTERAMEETFGSAIHGAGRVMSRRQAKRQFWGEDVVKELGNRGIIIRAHSKPGVAEEAPGAYKDVERIVDVMEGAGITRRVAKVRPWICVKG